MFLSIARVIVIFRILFFFLLYFPHSRCLVFCHALMVNFVRTHTYRVTVTIRYIAFWFSPFYVSKNKTVFLPCAKHIYLGWHITNEQRSHYHHHHHHPPSEKSSASYVQYSMRFYLCDDDFSFQFNVAFVSMSISLLSFYVLIRIPKTKCTNLYCYMHLVMSNGSRE